MFTLVPYLKSKRNISVLILERNVFQLHFKTCAILHTKLVKVKTKQNKVNNPPYENAFVSSFAIFCNFFVIFFLVAKVWFPLEST